MANELQINTEMILVDGDLVTQQRTEARLSPTNKKAIVKPVSVTTSAAAASTSLA